MPPGRGPPTPRPTHFLCIPLINPTSRPQLAESLASFRAVATSPYGHNLPAAGVRPLGTLHLTLGVMTLPRPEDLARALDLLRTLRPRDLWAAAVAAAQARTRAPLAVEAGKPSAGLAERAGTPSQRAPTEPRIGLRGLEHFGGGAGAQASVLYAPPADADGALRGFCEAVREPFLASGVMADEARGLQLHATVFNTTYVPKPRGAKGKMTVDARELLRDYEAFEWAKDLPLRSVAICKMGAKKVVVDGEEDEEYEVMGEVEV
jgi:activating signal cointegrator complex subunit 1